MAAAQGFSNAVHTNHHRKVNKQQIPLQWMWQCVAFCWILITFYLIEKSKSRLTYTSLNRHWPGTLTSHAPACVTWCRSCDTTVKFSLLKKAVRSSQNIQRKQNISWEVNNWLPKNYLIFCFSAINEIIIFFWLIQFIRHVAELFGHVVHRIFRDLQQN